MELRCLFFSLLMILEWAVEQTSADFLSFGLSHTICKTQLEFTESGKPIGPGALKERPHSNELPNECKWFQRTQNSASECSSGENCSYFSEKSCAELGISESMSEDSDQKSRIGTLIVGGREVDPPFKYPSFALLNRSLMDFPDEDAMRASRDQNIEGGFFCGAVIIAANWVLTAKHCAESDGFNTFGVMAGRHNISAPEETEQYSEVDKFIPHPNEFQGKEVKVDLTLLRLKTPLKFNEKIAPAQLPTKVYDTGEFTLIGRGAFKDFGNETWPEPDVPQEVDLPIITLKRCRELADAIGTNPDAIPDHVMCFYREPDSGASTCNGDSGSPAFKIEGGKQIVVGITWASTNGICGEKGFVGMHMQVFPFLKWIQDNMAANN